MRLRERNPDRVAAKAYADAHGFFWLPCSRCGEWMGGHEWNTDGHHERGVRCLVEPWVYHGACCPEVSAAADREACRRSHEMHGEEFITTDGAREADGLLARSLPQATPEEKE